jgi:beta-lactam-binding protein with PASTA domain
VQLVISAALQVEPAIEVPSLAGLTLPEAQKALEGIGLVLGKVTTLQPKV